MLQLGRDRTSSLTLDIGSLLSCLQQVAKGRGDRASFPHSCHCMEDEQQSQLCYSQVLRTGSAASPRIVVALVCCPDEAQGPLSNMLQLVRVRVSSPVLVTRSEFFHLAQVIMGKGMGGGGVFPFLNRQK